MSASGIEPDGKVSCDWVVPRRDENGQWWFCDTKVYMRVLPEEEKQAYLKKMLGDDYENK